jgi:hypothetical protein
MAATKKSSGGGVWQTLKPFVNGGAAGITATCVIQPVDIVKVWPPAVGTRLHRATPHTVPVRRVAGRRPARRPFVDTASCPSTPPGPPPDRRRGLPAGRPGRDCQEGGLRHPVHRPVRRRSAADYIHQQPHGHLQVRTPPSRLACTCPLSATRVNTHKACPAVLRQLVASGSAPAPAFAWQSPNRNSWPLPSPSSLTEKLKEANQGKAIPLWQKAGAGACRTRHAAEGGEWSFCSPRRPVRGWAPWFARGFGAGLERARQGGALSTGD